MPDVGIESGRRSHIGSVGILPGRVQPRYALSCTYVHGRLQLAVQKQLLKDARLPSGGSARNDKRSRSHNNRSVLRTRFRVVVRMKERLLWILETLG